MFISKKASFVYKFETFIIVGAHLLRILGIHKVPVPGNSDRGSFRVSKNAASVFALCPIAGTPCRCDDVNDLPESCLRS